MTYRKFALLFLILPLCAPLAGCPAATQQQTDIEILQGACIALDAGFTIAGELQNASQVQPICSMLTADAINFVPGTPSQDVQQAGADLLNLLNQIAPNSKLAAEISVVVSAVDAILQDIPASGTPAVRASISPRTMGKPAPRTVKQFNAQWNAALAANPVPGLKPLK